MGYDSNVFNSPTVRLSDFTFVVTPNVEGLAASSRATLSFRTAAEFVYFAEHETERGVNADLAGGGAVNLGRRITLAARGTYLNTRRRPNEEIDARVRRVETSGDASLRVALFGKVSVEAGLRVFGTEYDPDAVFDDTLLSETLNRTARMTYGGVRYGLTPLTAVSVGAEISEERFALSPIRDSDSKGAYGAIEFNPRARLSGSARVGYQRFEPTTSQFSSFSGVVGSASLGYRLRETTQLSIALDRRPLYSYAPEAPYFLWEAVGASILRSLTSTWALEFRGRHNWYRYRTFAAVAASLSGPARIDTWSDIGAGIRYQVNRHLTSTFHLTHWVRDSNVLEYENFNGLRVGTTMLFRF
jgi:hypothetical protein